jgi:hypothetical protein
MAVTYLVPTGVVGSSGISSAGGCSLHECVNNGIDGGTPNDSTYIYGAYSSWVTYSFDTPDLEDGETSLMTLTLRVHSDTPYPISSAVIRVYLDIAGDGSTDWYKYSYITPGGPYNNQMSGYTTTKNAAQLANMQFTMKLTNEMFDIPSLDVNEIMEVEWALTYEPGGGPPGVSEVVGVQAADIVKVCGVPYENILKIGGAP